MRTALKLTWTFQEHLQLRAQSLQKCTKGYPFSTLVQLGLVSLNNYLIRTHSGRRISTCTVQRPSQVCKRGTLAACCAVSKNSHRSGHGRSITIFIERVRVGDVERTAVCCWIDQFPNMHGTRACKRYKLIERW